MIIDYSAVTTALKSGADPAMLCMTCPWDRNCITPPATTTGEVNQLVSDAAVRDEAEQAASPGAPPRHTIMMAAAVAGRDCAPQACPVLVLRLRSSDGRRIAEGLKTAMQSWTDS